MKIETPKKPNKEAAKWEEHMNKKTHTAAKGPDAEIIPAKKKESVAPAKGNVEVMAKKEAPKAEVKQAAATAKPQAHTGQDHTHADGTYHAHAHEQPEVKKAAVSETKAAAKETKPAVKKEKVPKKSRKVILKKSKDASELVLKVRLKAGTPTFRGRFGKRNIRRKSIPKWNVWRVPRGIDVKKSMADGYMPRVGFATPREIRHVHPSGYRESSVKTMNELLAVPKGNAIRIVAGLGRKKKIGIVDKAIEMGVKVLNP
ncbi:MAG TPA: eL32 family ribosomal protein [archaeon]|nr:eL32 family ribosomal protein [archaeon]